MFDVVPMLWDWPVDINYHEAKAFCSWKGPDYRLLTEAEHNALRGNQVTIATIYNMRFGDKPSEV